MPRLFLPPAFILVAALAIGSVTAYSMWNVDRGESEKPKESLEFSSANVSDLASSVSAECKGKDDEQPCLERTILALTDPYGPERTMQTLTSLIADGTLHSRGDYHDFVHRIGRLTAKKGGLNPDAFFLCPVDYNYGCQHGFFEQALIEQPDTKLAAEMVCDQTRMGDKALKFLFYCYHGVGHGIMMARAYDLHASLSLCDEMEGQTAQTGCYQGVFMENVVGFINKTSRANVFSETDRLAPCNQVDIKYRFQCYLNHGGYLAQVAGTGEGAVERATQPCLNADPSNVHACFTSVGLMSTNPGWLPAFISPSTGDFSKDAALMCDHFPQNYKQDCVVAGVDNLANFDRSDTTRMISFCAAVSSEFKTDCFTRIGSAVKNELPVGSTPEDMCAQVPEEYRPLCISGASV